MEWTHTSNVSWAESLRRSREAMEEAARRPRPSFRPFSPFMPVSPPAPPRTPPPASAPAAAAVPQPAPPDPGPPPDLKEGDEVEARFGREWVRCVVAESYPVVYAEGPRGVWLRRKGRTRAGHLWPSVSRRVTEVRLVRKYDPATANVFADFLEEHGFSEAADALRAAFPLSLGAEEPKS